MQKLPYYITELPQGNVGQKGFLKVLAPTTNFRFGFRPPEPPETSAPPSTETTAVQEAAAEAARRRQRARGYRSTILTQNMMSPASPALRQTLGS